MPAKGLSSAEAKANLDLHGSNRVQSSQARSPWILLLEQFKSPLVLILLFACILSFVLREWAEAGAIVAILVLNALIGFFQEYKAETAVQALMEMTAPKARVLRDGLVKEIEASEVVPGDVLLLEAGDVIAADGNLIEAARLQVNEAILTGESLPVEKAAGGEALTAVLCDRHGAVFMGTSVSAGTGLVQVTATGMRTELGKIAQLLNTVQITTTPLQVQLAKVGQTLLVLCLVVVGVVFVLGLIEGRPWLDLLLYSISLAVAAVPEGMPAIVTVALAIGVQRMAARNALIRKLPSVETLGSVSVICTDKTGTLTTGQMRVREIWGSDQRHVVMTAASCCDANLGVERSFDVGDPTEIAILLAARERGLERDRLEAENPRTGSEPFDADRKRMSVSRQDGRNYVKGAPESIFAVCTPTPEISQAQAVVNEMSARGLRLLAVAIGTGTEEKNLTLVGLLGLADPPRTEVMDAIAEAKAAGILSVMITGDHPNTAAAIARELGLVTEGESLEGKVHARATPEDKLRIVRAWKQTGAIVAMTGDGVNDAPALREAHVGIAMGKAGTPVTKQSADLVLADDNFATIVAAIREGRGVYQNIRKAVVYLLAGNFAELATVLGASIMGLPVPFMAAHLLWINLVTDALPGLALIGDPIPDDIMKRRPRPASERLLGRVEWMRIILIGSLEALSVGALYWIQLQTQGAERARNLLFTTLVMSQLFRSFAARSRTKTHWQVGALSNFWLMGVVVVTFVLQISLHFIPFTQEIFGLHPIGLTELAWMLPFSLFTVSVLEMTKILRDRFSSSP